MNVYVLIADYRNFSYKYFNIVGVYDDYDKAVEDKGALEANDKEHDVLYRLKTAPFVKKED